MQLLVHLKFSGVRSQTLSWVLIQVLEASWLGVLAAAAFSPFYMDLFHIVIQPGPYSTSFTFALLALIIAPAIVAAASLHPIARELRACWGGLAVLFKLFPYLFFVPLFNYSLGSAFQSVSLPVRIVSLVNMALLLGYLFFHEFLNQSLKFRQVDFCNRRLISYADLLLLAMGLFMLQIFGSFYGSVAYLLRAIFVLVRLSGSYQYPLIQKQQLFYSLFTIYLSLLIGMKQLSLIDPSALIPTSNTLFLLTAGIVVSHLCSIQLATHISQRLLLRTQWGGERGEGQGGQRQQDQLGNFENELRVLVRVLLQRQAHLSGRNSQYAHYWRLFSEKVFLHRLKCEENRCVCKNKKGRVAEEADWEVFVLQLQKRVQGAGVILGKEGRLKVLNIYLLVQIARKPLKGYYQLISLKKEKSPLALQLEMEDLVTRARECFDQIFYKNKVQNQQLQLLKVIECQQVMLALEQQLRTALSQTAAFLQIFTYSTVKLAQVEGESKRLFALKRQIQNKLQRLVWQWGDNGAVSLGVFVFYRMLEVYRSRQVEFRKLGNQQVLKKRLLQKAEGQSVGEQQGIIYIDLVEERGRIRKITKNIADFFGYPKEDMIGFNINLFMPTLFGKYHARFLSNFIDKGRIKLLKERTRVVFGKNKRKFIFPVNVRLKTEHLQHDQFGASALLTPLDTSSEFLIAGNHGRVEEITEGLYRRLFGKSLREEVNKLGRLCAYKLLPGLNQLLEGWQEKMASKIHEGLLIFADREDYLMEKFRYSRQTSYSSISNKTKTLSMSLTSLSSASLPLDSKSQRAEYYAQLFKHFITDLNPSRLKAFKVSYKYSRIKTSQFQIEQIEFVTIRDELQGAEFLRELLNELNNVAEIYQLLEEHSPLARHLLELEDQLQERPPPRRNSKDLMLGIGSEATEGRKVGGRQLSLVDKGSETSFEEEEAEDKPLFNPNNSEQSSIIGNTETQSKKQLLINAFNGADSALAPATVTAGHGCLVILLALLGFTAYAAFMYTQHVTVLMDDCSFVLQLRSIVEFRLGLMELDMFASQRNATFSSPQVRQQLNLQMLEQVQQLNLKTNNDNFAYSLPIPFYDPTRGVLYDATLPQILNQLSWLFSSNSTPSRDALRYNYQKLHTSLLSFYKSREDLLRDTNKAEQANIDYIFAAYESLLFLMALCSLPLYMYFKRQEIAVRGKLAFMSVKEIRKAIGKLRLAYEFLRIGSNRKGAVMRLQVELGEKKGDRDEEAIEGSRSIKITTDAEQARVFRNPRLYLLLLAFVVFFSNLSVTLFVMAHKTSSYFIGVVTAQRLASELEIKTPLLLNVYLSNLNRALSGQSSWNFTAETLANTDQGYFELQSTLAATPYVDNPVAQQVHGAATDPLCPKYDCTTKTSLVDLTNSFRQRFDFWNPKNGVVPTPVSVNEWASENRIEDILVDVKSIWSLSLSLRNSIQSEFSSFMNEAVLTLVVLVGILIPVNVLGLIAIARRFLSMLNGIVKEAEQIFMHFPVSVLVENTYLTSYFNSKAKHGK